MMLQQHCIMSCMPLLTATVADPDMPCQYQLGALAQTQLESAGQSDKQVPQLPTQTGR